MSIAPTEGRSAVAVRLLKQFWLFAGLSDQDLARIARVASFRSMERDENLIDYGGSNRSVYCVLGGMVKLLIQTERRKERIVELVAAGRLHDQPAAVPRDRKLEGGDADALACVDDDVTRHLPENRALA